MAINFTKLRDFRRKFKLSQGDLSAFTRIPQWRLSLIERGIPPRDDEKEQIERIIKRFLNTKRRRK